VCTPHTRARFTALHTPTHVFVHGLDLSPGEQHTQFVSVAADTELTQRRAKVFSTPATFHANSARHVAASSVATSTGAGFGPKLSNARVASVCERVDDDGVEQRQGAGVHTHRREVWQQRSRDVEALHSNTRPQQAQGAQLKTTHVTQYDRHRDVRGQGR
jgi:hypothetical protein